MTPATALLFLGLLASSLLVFRFFGAGNRRVCPYCGSKTGEHDESCVWSSRD
jgi:hypothetical protein